jgi:N-methylhydantoinase A
LPLRVPVVDLIEIGAGGGSIVRVDDLGLVKVGPDSVGADPGPACYGRGGSHATVTDADLVLGYLDAGSFLGGRMQLDLAAARAAIEANVARPLGIGVNQAALRIHDIVNENMASASRVQAVERGHDPSGHSLVSFGGAGPVHAFGVARRLGLRTVVVPPSAGLGSAVGLLLAPRTFRLSRTFIGTLNDLDWRRIEALYDEMKQEALAALRQAGVADKDMTFRRVADMRYLGQRKELAIALPEAKLGSKSAPVIRASFEEAYKRVYHRIHDGHPIEALAWRLAAEGPAIHRPVRAARTSTRSRQAKPVRKRPMLFEPWAGHRNCLVFSRYDLSPGSVLSGPAVIVEAESTTVIGPNGKAMIDADRNIVVTIAGKVSR